MPSTPTRTTALALAACLTVGCTDPVTDAVRPTDARPTFAAKPGEPGSAADRQLYQVRLGDANGSRSHGVMLIEIVGGHLAVTVHAAGITPTTDPGDPQHIPQHIHLNPTCADGGGVLVNLDAGLTIPGEGETTGRAFPTANHAGVMQYYASRPLAGMIAPVNARFAADVVAMFGREIQTVDELLTFLNLEERNAHMHHSGPFTPLNCGEVVRLN